MIVDEEQHFGVAHKERLKALKADVHVLTLTATPIPRTLQMAMSGLRELSVIQTPPVDRLAVRTYVTPWDGVVLREALLREHHRGGQSFFVVPRVSDLASMEEWLSEQVPEVKAVTAHGQMSATEVEKRMSAFYDRKYDVLLSTTIIESGLDIPSANTLIVYRSDRFGLSQLYQLRGRVGRSKARAYAYLTMPEDRTITEAATKRLQVLAELDSLGAGFQLASHDLDIRGAGNLLGDEQSGHIKEVGFELYQAMLEEAILEVKAGGVPRADEFTPQISVDAPIMIPEHYVPDLDLRMGLYRRLGELEDRPAIDAFAAEMIDRFGALPEETANLLKIVEVKLNCREALIAKLDLGPKGAVVTFVGSGFPDLSALLGYIDRLNGAARLRPDSKLAISRSWPTPEARLNGALQLSRGLGPRRGCSSQETSGLGGLPCPPGGDEAQEFLLAQSRSAKKALIEVTTPIGEQRKLRLVFDPFDNHSEIEFTREADHRLDDDPVAATSGDLGDQPAIDLDQVERQRGEIGEARIAGAEIVDRNAHALLAQARQPGGDTRVGDQERIFGDFDDHSRRVDAGHRHRFAEAHIELVARDLPRKQVERHAESLQRPLPRCGGA